MLLYYLVVVLGVSAWRYGEGATFVYEPLPEDVTCETAGFYCPTGNIDSLDFCAGNGEYFCPQGSTKRHAVHEGYYTIPEKEEARRTGQLPCPGGYKCAGGIREPCQPGAYGGPKLVAQFHQPCNKDCPAGYCPSGSNVGTRYRCGDASVYCPAKSGFPTNVSNAHYTAGGSGGTTRTHQILCDPGHWCRSGLRFKCSTGHYGTSKGLTSPKLRRSMSRGLHWCPWGTADPYANKCDAVGGGCAPRIIRSPARQRSSWVLYDRE